MTAKHTPGPWSAHSIDDNGVDRSIWVVAYQGRRARNVCMVVDHGDDGPQERPIRIGPRQLEADARLIAAAPDLLEAAEKMLAEHPHLLACAAIQAPPGHVVECSCGVTALVRAIRKARGAA